MPIRPQFRYLYPIDWTQLSAVVRFKRAGGRCETCSRPHGKRVMHLGNGIWWDDERQAWRDGRGRWSTQAALRRCAALAAIDNHQVALDAPIPPAAPAADDV